MVREPDTANCLCALAPIVVVAGIKAPIAKATELEPIGTHTASCNSAFIAAPPAGLTAAVRLAT